MNSKIKIHIPSVDNGKKYSKYGNHIIDGQYQYFRHEIHELICAYLNNQGLCGEYIVLRKTLDIASWIYLSDEKGFRWASEDVDVDNEYVIVEWKDFIDGK